MEDWTTYANRNLSLTFAYPDPTPAGLPVIIDVKENDISFRVHLMAQESGEVYFEVGQYRSLSAKEEVKEFTKRLAGESEDLQLSSVVQTMFAGLPAQQFSASWPHKVRNILFFEQGPLLYRVIYDPKSPLNEQILGTLRFA